MKTNDHKILALKYRPQVFSELLGQDVMVQTIKNSIKLNKLPNAYLLTGIRGVGKTTTARIIAKALNCNKHFDHGEKSKNNEFCNCEEISNSKHLDVLEMDAASRTGIDNIRELIESSKYNPTSAKYKIIILDEVHMLSRQAFNGLLKTLEEPPPHLKFIFATTEVKKIPVTIISRCQRFDLHRVPIAVLIENLKKISNKENGKISEPALRLIAKASEGSVRDSLSLLDRALISQNIDQGEIGEEFIRKMLGIADRSRILELLDCLFKGEQKKSIERLRILIDEGIEPISFLNDVLEILYLILQKKNFGDLESNLSISESELETINTISKNLETSTIVIFWQFILKSMEELSLVSNPVISLEMLIIRLLHLKGMPSYEDVIDLLDKNNSISSDSNTLDIKSRENLNEKKEIDNSSKEQIKNTTQTKLELKPNPKKQINETIMEEISSFEDLIHLSGKKREIELKYDLERNVNLIKFSLGKIDISFNENLSKDFVRKLSEKLLEWTGKRWLITLAKEEGQKTFSETKLIEKKKILEHAKNGDLYKKFEKIFPDIELVDISKKD